MFLPPRAPAAFVLSIPPAAARISTMSEPVGKILAQARHKLGLTLDEAAHATKLRPDKILALENDDLASFASAAYAKGFVKNYARYLGVDVAEFLSSYDSRLPISVADYQYLSNAPEPAHDPAPRRRDRRPPSLIPVLIGAAVIFLAGTGLWVYKSAQRIFAEPAPRTTATAQPSTPAPTLPTVAPDLAVPSTLSLEPAPADPVAAEPRPPAPMLAADRALLKGGATASSADHDVVTPLPIPTTTDGAASAPPDGMNEFLFATVKKTWITVRKDDPKSPPVFEDYLYPGLRPLKLRGARFFIEARDPDSVQITKNGLPIAFQAPGVPIQ